MNSQVRQPLQQILKAFTFFMVFALSLLIFTGCASDGTQSESDKPQDKSSLVHEISIASSAAVQTCNDCLNGTFTPKTAAGALKLYEEEIDTLSKDAQEYGVSSSCSLYVGQLRATLESWEAQQAAGLDPEASLRRNMTSLQKEAFRLDQQEK